MPCPIRLNLVYLYTFRMFIMYFGLLCLINMANEIVNLTKCASLLTKVLGLLPAVFARIVISAHLWPQTMLKAAFGLDYLPQNKTSLLHSIKTKSCHFRSK